MKAEHFECTNCGGVFPLSERHIFDDQEFCLECLNEKAVACQHCGEWIWLDEAAGNSQMHLCQSCYDRYYFTCSGCGSLLRFDDAHYRNNDEDEECPYCDTCFAVEQARRSIQDYYYKPNPKFYGEGPRFFGVELEVDEAGESNRNADEIMEIANHAEDHIYCKHDGSLDDGFEIVTHPMSLDYHRHKMPWEAVLDKAISMGYRSHQAHTCGLHIHVNRGTFGTSRDAQDACIARILYFVEKHWEELLKFSRRSPGQLQKWAARYGYKEQPTEILEHAKEGSHGGRYTCVNLENYETIEFRMFRGSLRYNTLIATLRLVNRICNIALYLTDEELKNLSWTSFAISCTEPELIQYLKERRLYVNEPIDAAVEV